MLLYKKKISSIFQGLYIRIYIKIYQVFSEFKPVGFPNKLQPVLFMGEGEVIFGDNVKIGWKYSKNFFSYSYFEARKNTARIIIGNNVQFNNGCSLICDDTSIEINDNSLIGPNCEFLDSDFHELSPTKRHGGKPKTKKIKIGKNVFLSANVIVLKGATIGDNSVIGANSVVIGEIPKNCIAAGNPAKVIKSILE